jgi:hypothetical protein
VTLATEVQGGQTPDDLLESPNVGLVLDFSVAMAAVPASFVDAVCHLGMAREAIDGLVELWAQDASPAELFAAIGEIDAPAAAIDEARAGFVRFGRQDPQAWAPLVPQVAYAHAKFWELDDAGDDPATRTAELIDVLRDGGYDGFLSSEWGGSAWRDADEVDAFELVRRHHELISSPTEVRA